jgi:hypothetical protein
LDSNVGDRQFDLVSALVAIITTGWSLTIFVIWWMLFKMNDRFVKRSYKSIVFRDSVKVGIGMLQGLGLLIGVAVIAGLITSSVWWTIFITVSGIYGGLCWFRVFEGWPHLWAELKYVSLNKDVKDLLKGQRDAIINDIK